MVMQLLVLNQKFVINRYNLNNFHVLVFYNINPFIVMSTLIIGIVFKFVFNIFGFAYIAGCFKQILVICQAKYHIHGYIISSYSISVWNIFVLFLISLTKVAFLR